MNISKKDSLSLSLTQQLIRCPSVTPYDGGVMKVAADFLLQAGFNVEIDESGPEDWRIKNMIASYGSGQPHLAIIGHLDVVPAGDLANWRHDPFAAVIEDGRLFGRGAIDMKSGFACAAVAAKQLVTDGFKGKISFLITGDEEEGTEYGTRAILTKCKDLNIHFDACMVAEPTGFEYLGQAFSIGHRGSLNCVLSFLGKQGHVACPERALNPLPPLITCLSAILNKKWDSGEGMFPPTNLELTSIDVGNMTTNLIPSRATAKFNIRYNRLHNVNSLHKELLAILKDKDPNGCQFKLEVEDNGGPFICENNNLISYMMAAIKEELGVEPEISTAGGTTDGRFIHKYCPVVEFGMPFDEMHKANESVLVGDLNRLTRVYYHFYKLFFKHFS